MWGSLEWTLHEHHGHLIELTKVWAETAFEKDIQYRLWNARHGGVYVLSDANTPPNPYLTNHAERDVVTVDGRHLTLINPAYMTRQVFEMAKGRNAVLGHITSLKPIRPDNKPDDWETEALRAFEHGAKEYSTITSMSGERYYRLMRPLYVEQSCLKCHEEQGYHVGDVRGGISVAVPIDQMLDEQSRFTGLVATHAILWFLGLAGILLGTLALARRAGRLVESHEALEREVETRREAEAELRREHEQQVVLNQQLQQAHEQLLQSEKMAAIGQLAAGVAHEINNPTGYVISNLGTMQSYLEKVLKVLEAYERCEQGMTGHDERLREIAALKKSLDIDYLKQDVIDLLRESSEGMERVRRIVKDLKDFSHPDSGEWQWCDLHASIESTLNVVWNELKYHCEVVKEFGDVPPIFCIPSRINQVIMNLLTNAAQAIPEHGTITIRTGSEGEEAWFEVSDTGTGIAPEYLSRLFEPFFTTKPVGKGTGLGLSLSFGIVQKHAGRIEVSSTLGQGTTFRVWLPLHGGDEAPSPEASA